MRSLLSRLAVLLFASPDLSWATPDLEVLDEAELLDMFSGGSGDASPAAQSLLAHGVPHEQPKQETAATAQASTYRNTYRFAMGSTGSDSCPAGYSPINDDATCHHAATALGFSWSDQVYPDWAGRRPSGCFQHQPNQRFYNNDKYPGGVVYGNDKRVCQARLFGEKTILVIRIETLDANSDYCDVDCAWKLMFGSELQFGCQPTLDAATREASHGQMWFNESKSAVVTVQIPEREFGLPCDFNVVGRRARDLVKAKLGKKPESYDFAYHFLPSNFKCRFGGVAFLNGWAAYSAPTYTRNGIIKHELGHNFGLKHARALGGPFGSPGKEDGWDTGSSMGGGVIIGTAERYMLGWVSGNAVQDLGEFPAVKVDVDDPRLTAYWEAGDCGPQGDDFNWHWCGKLAGNCPELLAVSREICQSGRAKLNRLKSKLGGFRRNGCLFYWFAQYECRGPTTTTTTTPFPDMLVKIAAARHPLSSRHGPHSVIFSLWSDVVFALSYRTPHGTDGASMKAMHERFAWVVDHKVNIHRLIGGRQQGRGIGAEVLYAGVGLNESFTLDRSPVSHRGNFTLEVCSADDDQAVVSLSFHAGGGQQSACPSKTTTTTTTPSWTWLDLSGKVATQSSNFGGLASRAIDGNTNTNYYTGTCTHTSGESNPWWQVDLGSKQAVRAVKVTNRGDCCGERLSPFSIILDGIACASNVVIGQGETKQVACEGLGQVVRVEVSKWTWLTICEFQLATSVGGSSTTTSTTTTSAATTTMATTTMATIMTTTSAAGTTTKTVTSTPSSTSTATQTSTSSTTGGIGIQSGDTVFLKSRSGNGNHIDVEGSAVQARWESQGNFQALVIEKANGGNVNSGDTVYLKTHTGSHIDITDQGVQARWNDQGGWQAMVIEKRNGYGAILPGDSVCFMAHTGKHLDVEGAAVRARWNDCGDWQAMLIQKEVVGAVFSGTSIHLLAHTGKRLDVEGSAVQARWSERGEWQTFVIENYGGRAIFSGDAVFLKAHTGMLLDVQDVAVQARWPDYGDWQKLLIEKKHGSGAVMPGDPIFLRAHTGKMIEVEGEAVSSRWFDQGRQKLVIEKARSRRLAQTTDALILI
jgi:hypothetical protein